jgi:hypothetical protein
MSTMNRLLLLFQVGSVLVAYLLSRLIVGAIVSRISRGAEQGPSYFATPGGSALLFGLTFVVVWFALCGLAVLGWLWLHRGG